LDEIIDKLAVNGIIYSPNNGEPVHRLFIKGKMERKIRTHHIHIVKYKSEEWNNYLNFRDYLNYNKEEAKKYEIIKIKLCEKNKNNRENYTKSKEEYISKILEIAKEWKENNM
jgi:GrpB-like predicted nucleotidyltransferase (UPF0157 family)